MKVSKTMKYIQQEWAINLVQRMWFIMCETKKGQGK